MTANDGEVIGYAWADDGAAAVDWMDRKASSRSAYEASLDWWRKVKENQELGLAPRAVLTELSRHPAVGPVTGAPSRGAVEELAAIVTPADDRRLLAQLRRDDSAAWQELADAFDALTEEDRRIGRGGGEELREGVYHVFFPVYSTALLRAVTALAGVGAVTPEHRWMGQYMPELPPGGRLHPADAVRAATAVVRGERFCDGTIAEAVKSGLFDAIGESLRIWYRTSAQ
ncbi:DUF6508 domain-containing protein [Streptomyces sp. NPDC055722]